jgi:putative resolvase
LGSGDPGAVLSAVGRRQQVDVCSLKFVVSGRPFLNRLAIASALTRVSGQGQKDDLETQLARLQAWAKVERAGKPNLVLSDIGSGLKAKRIHLQQLLKMVMEDQIAEIVITSPDRLTRFGQEYLQVLFDCFGVRLTILEPDETKTPEQELTDDLLALIASFSGRLYGMRSHKQKELLKCAQAVINNP